MLTVSLIQNISMLVALSLLHALLLRGFKYQGFRFSLISGMLFGFVAIAGMMTPVQWADGVFFDGRSIILGIAGLFGGPLTAGIAALMAGAYRFGIGGDGVWMGLGVIAESALIGTAAHILRKRHPAITRMLPMYLLGLLIHAVMVCLMYLLPGRLSGDAFRDFGLPVLTLYPAGFMLVGRVFLELEKQFKTEKALLASQTRNRALLDAIPDMLFVISKDGRILDHETPPHTDPFVPPHAFLGHTIEEILPAEISTRMLETMAEARKSGKVATVEYTLEYPEGRRHFESRIANAGEDVSIAIVRDITKRANALQALRESRAFYEDLMSSAMAGIYRIREEPGKLLDAHNVPRVHYEFLNDRFCELTGISRERHETDPSVLTAAIHPDDRPGWVEKNRIAVRDHTAFSWDGRLLVDGRYRWLHFESRPRLDENGQRFWTGVLVDVHDRVRAENQRQEMELRMMQMQKLESLEVLAGGVAHDFNNILMAVLGHAEMAIDTQASGEDLLEHLQSIRQATLRAAELSRQMLAYSGRGHFVIETIDLCGLVGEMSQLMRAAIGQKADLRLNLANNLPTIEGDATQIRQLLMNLITNAADAVGEHGGRIDVSTGARHCDRAFLEEFAHGTPGTEGNHVYMRVRDNGCGMDQATLGRIFEPFFTTKFTGRGLGMAAAQGIVRGHKGFLRVQSQPGAGTTFEVYFPAANLSLPPANPELPPSAAPCQEGRVLLVDDEESLRSLGSAMLRKMGLLVDTAQDGIAALEAVQLAPPDTYRLVILDLTMPNMDGEETFRELRKISPNLPIVLCSGYSRQDVIGRFTDHPPAGFLQKPYTMRDLAGILPSAQYNPTKSPPPDQPADPSRHSQA